MRQKKTIGPSTEATYRARLTLAYGKASPPFGRPVGDLRDWTGPMRAQLRAAVAKFAPERLGDLPDEPWTPKRAIQPPSEIDLASFETRADTLSPERRAMVLLPLALGLRSAELLSLTRDAVERAVSGEDLLVFRKGGRERLLTCDNARPLLADLLETPRWSNAWEILSRTSERAAYARLRRLIRSLGGEAKLRPHKLRHGFATRMMRAGAGLPQIQFMMDHSNPETTSRYVHPEKRDLVQYLQPTTRKKK